jgi:hypothetical protein
VQWNVVDQANNSTTPATFVYYIDNTAPAVAANPIAIPASIGAGTTFSTTGGAVTDNVDIGGVNGVLNYPGPGIRFLLSGSATATGTALDSTLVRSADGTITFPSSFYRFLTPMTAGPPGFGAGSKPDMAMIRAYDAAQNLSTELAIALPPGNISGAGAGANPYIIGGTGAAFELQDFTVCADAAGTTPCTTAAPSRDNTPGPASITLTGRVTASTATVASPFTQVCFYYSIPTTTGPAAGAAGGTNNVTFSAQTDLVLIGCSSTPTVTTTGTNRLFDYTQVFTVSSSFGAITAGNGGFPIRAVGTNANGDALITLPITLTTT